MITTNDYLKPIKKMTEQEKEVYFDKVKKWTEEDYPRLCAVQEAWTANEFKSFDEGCVLISALQGARAWLPAKIYQKDIQRRLTWVRDWLSEINRRYGKVEFAAMPHPSEAMGRAIYVNAKAERNKDYAQVVKGQADAALTDGKIPETSTARPKHLDAYLHLLPAKVQADAAQLPALYLKLGELHGMLQLKADPRHDPRDRQKYAQAVVRVSDSIDAIYAEVEAAWEVLPEDEKAKAGIPAEAAPKPAAKAEPAQPANETADADKPKKATAKKATGKKAPTKKPSKKTE